MPRVRNGKPEGSAKRKSATPKAPATAAAGKKKPRKRGTGRPPGRPRKTEAQVPQMVPLGENAAGLSIAARTRMGQQVAVERAKGSKSKSWPTLAKEHAIDERALRRIYATHVQMMAGLDDMGGRAAVDEALLLMQHTITDAFQIAAEATTRPAEKISALKLAISTLLDKLELMHATGRMPRSWRAVDEIALLEWAVQKMAPISPTAEQRAVLNEVRMRINSALGPLIEGRGEAIMGRPALRAVGAGDDDG